jgi:hypothetical protein
MLNAGSAVIGDKVQFRAEMATVCTRCARTATEPLLSYAASFVVASRSSLNILVTVHLNVTYTKFWTLPNHGHAFIN